MIFILVLIISSLIWFASPLLGFSIIVSHVVDFTTFHCIGVEISW